MFAQPKRDLSTMLCTYLLNFCVKKQLNCCIFSKEHIYHNAPYLLNFPLYPAVINFLRVASWTSKKKCVRHKSLV